MKVYISGPITGQPNAREEFARVEAELHAAGFETVNPFDNGLTEESPWIEHMKMDVTMLMDCDLIHLMPGWGLSQGCRLEAAVAKHLGIKRVRLARGLVKQVPRVADAVR